MVRCLLVALVAVVASANPARAGSSSPSGTTNLIRANGEGDVIASGDWVSEPTGGLGTFYSYFIEVPPGTGSLVVEVFDADNGAGGQGGESFRDLRTGNQFNTTVTYQLRNPGGTQVGGTVTCTANGAAPCLDNAWSNLFGAQANPAAGHWELRVNLGGGDETVAYGVRAHDGNSGSGGTELNVYAHSFVAVGPTTTTTQANTLHPWVTSGCQARINDFDLDAAAGSSVGLVGAAGFSQTFGTVSGNGAWSSQLTNRFTTDDTASNYGVWSATTTVQKPGGAAANVGTFYVGAFNSATAGTGGAPTAQPEANTFRLYLPTDGGSSPVKPQVEQFAFPLSGAIPPAPGQTTRVAVTVRITNPTSRPIVFSAANLVSATIPGAGVVYAGTPQVGQGAVVAQPAIGGTGAITWNPGTLAAGATSILAWNVDVTPASAGQRLVVTGTPAANGTTARYVDETGNTTQARATVTFGPLCEVAVTAGLTTRAVVADVRALPIAGGLRYQVRTVSEVGTVGFVLERFDDDTERFVPVHDKVLAAWPARPGGRLLEIEEPGGPQSGSVRLRLVETEWAGTVVHGPFDVTIGEGALVPDAAPVLVPLERVVPDAGRLVVGRPGAGARAEVRVHERGVQRINRFLVAMALGIRPQDIADELDARRVALTRGGLPVPWTVVGGDLVFFGDAGRDAWEADGVYELVPGDGRAMETDVFAPAGAASDVITARVEQEQDLFPVTVLPLSPDDDFWMESALLAGDPDIGSAHLSLLAPDAVDGGVLQLEVLGGTAQPHEAAILIDGVEAARVPFDGIARAVLTVPVDVSALSDGVLDIDVIAVVPAGADPAAFNVFFIDAVALEAPRWAAAGVEFIGNGSPARFVVGADVIGLDIQDPNAPRVLSTQADGSTVTVATTAGARHVVADVATFHRPVVTRDALPSVFSGVGPTLDVAIVVPGFLAAAAEDLVSVHASRGLSSRAFVLEDIEDAYGHGRRGVDGLRRFLRDAHERYALRFVVLAGSGSLDERGLLGANDALLPTPLRRTPGGLVAHDLAYGDVDGDGLMDLAVGRIPVMTADALQAYAAQSAAAEAPTHVLVANDNDEEAGPFSLSALDVSDLLPWSRDIVDLGAQPLASARAGLSDALRARPNIVLYVGHGGLDRLANEGLLTSDDLASLDGVSPSVFVGLTCVINRFEDPAFAGLGEQLVTRGVASAILAPASPALHGDSEGFGRALAAELPTAGTLGTAYVRAARASVLAGDRPDAALAFTILGDPTTPVGEAPPSGEPASAGCASVRSADALLAVVLLFARRRRRWSAA